MQPQLALAQEHSYPTPHNRLPYPRVWLELHVTKIYIRCIGLSKFKKKAKSLPLSFTHYTRGGGPHRNLNCNKIPKARPNTPFFYFNPSESSLYLSLFLIPRKGDSKKEDFTEMAATNIGMMDSAYFVGRSEILAWINSTLNLSLTKVEEVVISFFIKKLKTERLHHFL